MNFIDGVMNAKPSERGDKILARGDHIVRITSVRPGKSQSGLGDLLVIEFKVLETDDENVDVGGDYAYVEKLQRQAAEGNLKALVAAGHGLNSNSESLVRDDYVQALSPPCTETKKATIAADGGPGPVEIVRIPGSSSLEDVIVKLKTRPYVTKNNHDFTIHLFRAYKKGVKLPKTYSSSPVWKLYGDKYPGWAYDENDPETRKKVSDLTDEERKALDR